MEVVQGFSELNRALMYVSAILAPAQAVSGIGHTGLSNIGFLAYNWYTQVVWYRAASNQQLSALALVTGHANTTLAFAYIGGIFSGNRVMSILLSMGAMGVLGINNATAWISWKTGQRQGYGEWEFFFFGWRTLTDGWHKFFLLWQISNSLETLAFSIICISLAARSVGRNKDANKKKFKWWHRAPAIPVGGAFMTVILFPYILFIELIVRRNRVQSETDWIAVYVFIGQVALLFLPDFGKCWKRIKNNDEADAETEAEEEKRYYSLGIYFGISD